MTLSRDGLWPTLLFVIGGWGDLLDCKLLEMSVNGERLLMILLVLIKFAELKRRLRSKWPNISIVVNTCTSADWLAYWSKVNSTSIRISLRVLFISVVLRNTFLWLRNTWALVAILPYRVSRSSYNLKT